MVGRIMLRRVFGAAGKISSEAGGAPSAQSVGVRCNAGRPLLLTTALGTGILVGAAGLTLGSTQALAACSSGTIGTQTCSGILTDQNIAYTATGALPLKIEVATISDSTADGIHVDGNGFPVQVYFTTDGNPNSVVSTNGDGIEVTSNGGGVGVNTIEENWFTQHGQDMVTTISGSQNGILATQTSAASVAEVNVTIGKDIVSGGSGSGIKATSAGAGPVTVSAGAGSQVSSTSAEGIYASGAGGNVSVSVDGGNITGSTAGIDARNTTGNISIDLTTSGGNVGIAHGTGSSGEGIYAQTTGGTGTITIDAGSGTSVVSDSYDGIGAVSGGTGLIHITADGSIEAGNGGGDDGIVATGLSGAGIKIDFGTGNTAATISASGNGIEAQNNGSADIEINALGQITNKAGSVNTSFTPQNNESGIWAYQQGTGNIAITTGTKSIEGGLQTSDPLGTGTLDYGIFAWAAGGSISVDTGTGEVKGGDDAIRAIVNNGSGNIDITTTGAVTSVNSDGIHAQNLLGNGNITIETGDGAITGGTSTSSNDVLLTADYAIFAQTLGGGIDITTGKGNLSSGGDAIFAQTSGSETISITTGDGTVTSASNDGIHAQNLLGSGNIEIETGKGAITGGSGSLDYGIYALATTGGITVTTGQGNISSGDDAIFAQSSGSQEIHITTGDGNVTSTANDGIHAQNLLGSGNIVIETGNGAITGSTGTLDFGIYAQATTGGISITTGAGNVSSGDDAIEAITTGSRDIEIKTGTGSITSSANDGIYAQNLLGTGGISIETGAGNITSGNDDYGVYARTLSGDIDITVGTETIVGGDTIHSGGTINGGAEGVHAQVASGNGNINITTHSEVTAQTAGGTAIHALSTSAGSGDITVTNYGTVGDDITATAGSGIIAENTNASSTGNVTVNVDNSVYADGVYGVKASTAGAGDASVVVADDVTIDPTGYGAYAYSAGGNASIATGAGDSVTVTSAGSPAYGLYAESKKTADDNALTPTVSIVTGDANTVDVTGDNSFGVYAVNSGATGGAATGSVVVDLSAGDAGTSIHVTGDTGIGILAATYDPFGSFNGAGDVTVKTGAGNITVDGGDGVGGLLGSSVGIATYSDGGNISITTGTGAITVSSETYNTVGIYAKAGRQSWGTPAGQVDIATYGAITTSNGNGIEAYSHDGNLNIDTYAAIDATGDSGIYADADGTGDVTIVTHAHGTISGNANDGIKAESDYSGTGNVSVTINDAIGTSGNYVGNNGIEANVLNSGSAGTVKVQANASIYAGNNGIVASNAGSGTVDVTAGTDTVIDATNGAGISATGAGGAVTVTADGTGITGSTDGIYAQNTTGNIVVDLNSGTVTGTGSGGEGIYATTGSTGTITITQDAGTTVNSISDDGIEAVSTGTGLIHITSNGNITAGNNGGDDGITAIGLSAGAPITIDFGTGNANASITAAGNGIEAQTSGAGKITVNAYGTINNVTGDLGANVGTLQNNESGIWTKQTGTGDIEINTGTKSISAGTGQYDYGIYAQAADGNIDITTGTGTVTGGDDGIHAEVLSGSGTANVTANGNVTSTVGSAIDVASATGNITVTNYGTATSATDPVVKATTNGAGVTINNKAEASIKATDATPSWSAVAIQTSTGAGAVKVQNDGDITGRVDFDLASTGGATFNNTANTWYTSGTNNFTAGDDTLDNTSSGVIETSGTTTFAFGIGADVVTNDGTFYVTGNTIFTDLENFNNSGTLDLSGRNTDTIDKVTIDGAFNGTGSSKLILDAYLGGPEMAANTVDLLTIGGSTGSTAIRINNLASGYGSYLGANFANGLLVVDGSSGASTFTLDTTQPLYSASKNALDAGLFAYKLVYNSGEERLISLPDNEASELPTLLTAAQGLWYETSPWLDRQADLRDQLDGGKGTVTPGLWGKVLGHWTSRDTSQTVSAGGTSMVNKADYNQDTYGFVAGIDTGSSNVLGQGDTLLGGVSAGYVTSDQNFKSSPTTAEYKGAVLGIYATYLKGDFFVDAMAKANLLSMDYKAPSLGNSTASPDVKSYGVELDAGQRFPLSESTFVEPLASLTYAKTSIDSFSITGARFDFKDATSFRGSLGLRGGATAYKSSETKVDLSLTGRLWNEFEGDNKMVIHSAGPDLTMTDKFDGTFGEVVGSVNVFGLGDGLSGFVNGGAKFKSNYTSGELTAGLRYEW